MEIAIYHAWIHTQGGAEKVLKEFAERTDHNITIYTSKYIPENTYEEFQEMEIQVLGDLPIVGEILRGATFGLQALLTNLELEEYDAFLVSTAGIAEFVNYRNHNTPLIGFCHTPLRIANDPFIKQKKFQEVTIPKRFFLKTAILGYKLVEKPAWKFFDHVIFNSENSRNRAFNSNLIEEKNTSIANPGVDIEGKGSEKFEKFFFYPSRFADYKRQELAVLAYKAFKQRNPETDFELIIAGSVNEEKEDYFQKVKEQAEQVEGVKIERDVDGERWDYLYRNCYGVLFCAINEDWGLIPIEAGAYEKPVIVPDNQGGHCESVDNRETGLYADVTPKGYAEMMESLALDRGMAEKLGKNGRRKVEKNYTWDEFTSKVEGDILSTVNGGASLPFSGSPPLPTSHL